MTEETTKCPKCKDSGTHISMLCGTYPVMDTVCCDCPIGVALEKKTDKENRIIIGGFLGLGFLAFLFIIYIMEAEHMGICTLRCLADKFQ